MDDHQILKQMQLFDEFYDAEIKAFIRAAVRRSEADLWLVTFDDES